MVRIRIKAGAERVEVTGPPEVRVEHVDGKAEHRLSTPVVFRVTAGKWGVRPQSDVEIGRAHRTLRLRAVGAGLLRVGGSAYPGTLRLMHASDNEGRVDVINDVPLEQYLPGVLEEELYSDWSPATYRAQAIVARSYAIHRRNPDRPYDMEATQAAQVYAGADASAVARRAVAATAGLVLTYQGDVLKALYSSTCGGRGQSPKDAFGGKAKGDLRPLQPTDHRAWCSQSKHYRWGPIERKRKKLAERLAAWGRDHGRPIAGLSGLSKIEIVDRNHLDRPTAVRLRDRTGETFRMTADRFRRATNFADAELAKVPRKRLVRSGDLEVRLRGSEVVFEGRGFGHGVGLCQFGAEGMAKADHSSIEILRTYYPGAKVERAY